MSSIGVLSLIIGLGAVAVAAVKIIDLIKGLIQQAPGDGFTAYAAPRLVVFTILLAFGVCVIYLSFKV